MNLLTKSISYFLVTLSPFQMLASQSFSATIHPLGKPTASPDFVFVRLYSENKFTSKFAYPNGKPAAVETITLNENGQPSLYKLQQYQTNERAFFKITTETVFMEYTKNGETKKEELNNESNMIIPPMLLTYIQDNWQKIKNDMDHEVKLIIPHMLTYFRFSFRYNPKKPNELIFEPSNFLVRWIADPLVMKIEPKSGRVVEASGPSMLFKRDGKKLKAFLGTSIFNYDKESIKNVFSDSGSQMKSADESL
ncbi:MAG: hypothetical protein AB8E15_07365 [Bdellovibrionales bacterium]